MTSHLKLQAFSIWHYSVEATEPYPWAKGVYTSGPEAAKALRAHMTYLESRGEYICRLENDGMTLVVEAKPNTVPSYAVGRSVIVPFEVPIKPPRMQVKP